MPTGICSISIGWRSAMLNFAKIPRLARSLSRLVEIVRTLAKYGLADTIGRLDYRFVRRWTSGTELARLSVETREARIRLVLTELGTTFIKFGQVLSTRPDLIGPALGDELTKLQVDVPADSFAITRATIEAELGRPLVQLFTEFVELPLASGSIGQVHRATLPDGSRVAVKVQHPDIMRRISDDLAILHELARLAEQFLPEFRIYRPMVLVAEFERALIRELNFSRELRHLQLFRQAFAADPTVRFPQPYPAHSSSRVLTMDFFEGIPFNRPEEIKSAGGDFEDLARRGTRVFLDMIFRDGFFHADPHPGNLMFLPPTVECPNGAIGLLDVGMVARLDDKLRERIERALWAVARHDAAAITELILQVGDVPHRFDHSSLEADVCDQLAFYQGMSLEQFQLGTALNDMIEAIRRYRIMLPGPLALLLRVMTMLEGTGRMLAPQFNLMEMLEPYQHKMVLKKLSPRRIWRNLATFVGDWDDLFRQFPRQIGSVFRLLQKQEIGVQLMHRHLEPSVNRVVFGLMVSALFVGSSMLWAFRAPPVLADISIFGAVGCLASGLLGYHLFRAIQHSGHLEEPEDRLRE
jgi:ubiquinone biosynthesis protein